MNPKTVRIHRENIATFGAGCFWHVEEAFRQNSGVIATSVGYMGGHFENPLYLDVLARITGHAEVTQIEYDPEQVTYLELLDLFWCIHDPTTLNRQGPDRGEQYRSIIFYHTPEQHQQAIASKHSHGKTLENPIVTAIEAAMPYWQATEDHQQYFFKKNTR